MCNINLENMSYADFENYCSERACDGNWSMFDAMACIDIIDTINKIKVKGLFGITNKKKTMEAREKAWKEYGFKTMR